MSRILQAIAGAALLGSLYAEPAAIRKFRAITAPSLVDKIRGGWAGQMIGVSFGAPTEFRSNGRIIEDNLGGFMDCSPERVRTPSIRMTSTSR